MKMLICGTLFLTTLTFAGNKPSAKDIKRDYFANDQHDNYRILLVEARSEREQNRIEQINRNIRLERLRWLDRSGAIPGIMLITMEHEAAMAKVLQEAQDFRIQAAESKLQSLEGLIAGDGLHFLRGDVNTNFAQWKQFEQMQKRAGLEVNFHVRNYNRLQAMTGSGAVSWAKTHAAELERDQAIVAEQSWAAKVKEQEAQYRKAAEELKKWETARPK